MFERTKLRGLTHRSMVAIEASLAGRNELDQRVGMIQGSVVSIALAHACYPTTTYKDDRDQILTMIKQSSCRPVDPNTAANFVSAWLERNEMTMSSAFQSVWGIDYLSFMNLVKGE